ncbi:hypothetical protein ACH5RR_003870 [Cinchona calisaya]|uniref:Uncharacterized protein n=1 Tax=Cinchona calisaya TaxID=153742 RepID=A0ABD3AW06_9GENT
MVWRANHGAQYSGSAIVTAFLVFTVAGCFLVELGCAKPKSSEVFAIALLASGQSSTITKTYAGQYVMQGFLDLTMKPWIRNFLTRSLAIVPSLIVAIIGGSSGAGNLIIITSMILSFELPFALIPLLKFTSCKTKMGNHANSTLISAATWVFSSLIMGINIYYLGEKLVTTLHHSKLRVVGIVFCGILGVFGMLVYLAGVLYCMVRKTKNADNLLPETVQMAAELGNAPSVSSLPREHIVNMQLPQWRTTSDVDKNSSSSKVFIRQAKTVLLLDKELGFDETCTPS